MAFTSPLSTASIPALHGTLNTQSSSPATQPGNQPAIGLAQTLQLIETNAQLHSQLATMSSHATDLERQLRAQEVVATQAKAAHEQSVQAHTKLVQNMEEIVLEKERVTAQLDHYMGRTNDLVAERGKGTQQLTDLGRVVAEERRRGRIDSSELSTEVGALEEALAQQVASNQALERQNASMLADLKEVMTLIDQLEGEPGFALARLKSPAKAVSPARPPHTLPNAQGRSTPTRRQVTFSSSAEVSVGGAPADPDSASGMGAIRGLSCIM